MLLILIQLLSLMMCYHLKLSFKFKLFKNVRYKSVRCCLQPERFSTPGRPLEENKRSQCESPVGSGQTEHSVRSERRLLQRFCDRSPTEQ